MRPPHRRLKSLGLALLGMGIFAGVGWPLVRPALLLHLVLAGNVPGEEVIGELVSRARDPAGVLESLWNTGRIVHRQRVLELLKDGVQPGQPLVPRLEALARAGALDEDISLREGSLGLLAMTRNPHLTGLALAQLSDPDPEVRMLGLQHLRGVEPGKALAGVIPLLDDPDLRVVATAESALRNWTREDFGVRVQQSIPVAEGPEAGHVASTNLAHLREGVQRRKAWWTEHQAEYPAGELARMEIHPAGRPRTTRDFTLYDLDGHAVRLSQFHGKVVLLNFWTTWCTACVAEMPALVELARRHHDDLVILGVSLDGVPDSHGHAEGHADPGEPGHASATEDKRPSLRELQAKVERVAKARHLSYPILLDPDNTVGSRFNGGELPTNVILDREGNLRRRFIGARSLEVYEALLNGWLGDPANPARLDRN